jgi:hypothetical protein
MIEPNEKGISMQRTPGDIAILYLGVQGLRLLPALIGLNGSCFRRRSFWFFEEVLLLIYGCAR